MKYMKNLFGKVLFFSLVIYFNSAAAQVLDEKKLEALNAKGTDVVFGNANSKVVIVEFSSLSCPHCALFHKEVLPKIKKELVDTGKVRYIIKDFPLNTPATYATMLANCSSDKKYQYVSMLLEAQNMWAFTNDYKNKLHSFAKLGGMSDAEFDKCWNDNSAKDAILKSAFDSSKALEITGTPTFFINGKRFDGEPSFTQISKEIDNAAFNIAAGKN